MKTILKIICYYLFPKLTKGASVLMYHSVDENRAFFNVAPKDFERQIGYLHNRRFRVVLLSDLFKMVSEGRDISSCVSITFDDGYESVFRNALPVLKKYDMQASIFISSGLLGTTYTTSDGVGLPIVSLDMLHKYHDASTFELLSHTKNHHELPRLSKEEIAQELSSDIDFLNTRAKTPKILAYPRGKFSGDVIDVLKAGDWQGAVTTVPGLFAHTTLPFVVPRNFVGRPTSFFEFKTLLSDGVHYYAKLRSWYTDLFKKS